MKPFELDSSHTNMSGVFYPSGHVFALFRSADEARQAADALESAGHKGEAAYASPETILRDVVRTLGNSDAPLPSVGADGDIVRRIADLASAEHHGLLVEMGKHDDVEMLTSNLRAQGAAAAFYYRTFIIEDLIEQQPTQAQAKQSVTVGTHAAAPQPDER